MSISRRSLLRGGAQALVAASLLRSVPTFSAGARDIRVQDLNGLSLFTGAGCNVVALGGPDGALLVDGGLAANSPALLKVVAAQLKTKRVSTLINTHWHPEQTGSNLAVGNAGGTIIAHEVTKLSLGRRENLRAVRGHLWSAAGQGAPHQDDLQLRLDRVCRQRGGLPLPARRPHQWRPVRAFPEARRHRRRRAGVGPTAGP